MPPAVEAYSLNHQTTREFLWDSSESIFILFLLKDERVEHFELSFCPGDYEYLFLGFF